MSNQKIPPKAVTISLLKASQKTPKESVLPEETKQPPPDSSNPDDSLVQIKQPLIKPVAAISPQMGEQNDEPSLPVLQAFQNFIEAERKNAKKQASLLAVAFLFIILIVASGGVLASMFYVSKINLRIGALQNELASVQNESRTVKTNTVYLLSDINKKTSLLESTLSSSESMIDSTRIEFTESLVKQNTEIANIRKVMTAMQEENDRLKKNLLDMRNLLSSRKPEVSGATSAGAVSQHNKQVVFMIQPDGFANAFPWRIPTGE